VIECRSIYDQECLAEAEAERKRVEAEAKAIARKKAFFDSLEKSSDLNENLQGLAEYVQEITKATGVYIGKLVCQK
jgi:uncharacterized membrane protein YqiK